MSPEVRPSRNTDEEGREKAINAWTFLFFHKTEMKKKKKPQAGRQLSPQVLEKIQTRAAVLAAPHGLAVHGVAFGPTDLGLTLSVTIRSADDEEKALSVTDCELVSRPLSKELDDLIEDDVEPYMFEVCSVGIKLDTLKTVEEEKAPERYPNDES